LQFLSLFSSTESKHLWRVYIGFDEQALPLAMPSPVELLVLGLPQLLPPPVLPAVALLVLGLMLLLSPPTPATLVSLLRTYTSAASEVVCNIVIVTCTSYPCAAAEVHVATCKNCLGVTAPSTAFVAVACVEVSATSIVLIARLSSATASNTSARILVTIAIDTAFNTSTG
jgi:hypothetical protein